MVINVKTAMSYSKKSYSKKLILAWRVRRSDCDEQWLQYYRGDAAHVCPLPGLHNGATTAGGRRDLHPRGVALPSLMAECVTVKGAARCRARGNLSVRAVSPGGKI